MGRRRGWWWWCPGRTPARQRALPRRRPSTAGLGGSGSRLLLLQTTLGGRRCARFRRRRRTRILGVGRGLGWLPGCGGVLLRLLRLAELVLLLPLAAALLAVDALRCILQVLIDPLVGPTFLLVGGEVGNGLLVAVDGVHPRQVRVEVEDRQVVVGVGQGGVERHHLVVL